MSRTFGADEVGLAGRDVLVLAPHLDDAWLSVAAVLQQVRCEVWTVFAGAPDPVCTTEWDRRCGFADSAATTAARQAEDEAAFAGTAHEVRRLHHVDAPYADLAQRRADRRQLSASLATWWTAHPDGAVIAPVGAGVRVEAAWWQRLRDRWRPSDAAAPPAIDRSTHPIGDAPSTPARLRRLAQRAMHADASRRRRRAQRRGMAANPDHLLVRDVALGLLGQHPEGRLVLSEDLPYLWHEAGAAQARLLGRRGVRLEPVTVPVERADKARRVQCYTSQLPVLDPQQRRLERADTLPTDETYWLVRSAAPPRSRA